MDSKELIQLMNELVEGLFSVNVSCIDHSLSSFQAYYINQLPSFLSPEQKDDMAKKIVTIPKLQTIAYYTDPFFINYIVFPCDDDQLVVLGPYLVEEITNDLTKEAFQNSKIPNSYSSIFYNYLQSMPICRNKDLIFFARTMIRKFMKTESDPAVHHYTLEWVEIKLSDQDERDLYLSSIIPHMEERYVTSEKMLLEVTNGNSLKAKQHYRTLKKLIKPIKRYDNPLRNKKNLAIVLNTILRFAAKKACVHPIHMDTLSSHYAILIESATNITVLEQLEFEMIDGYSNLVNEYSLKSFSPVIRKTITFIRVHLSDELSLEQLAQNANVSTTHLSRLFNKEVHESIPNYINRTRADKAAQLLETSHYSVQEVGEYVGFYDLNYFTKVFKKYYQIPPVQYQRKHSYY